MAPRSPRSAATAVAALAAAGAAAGAACAACNQDPPRRDPLAIATRCAEVMGHVLDRPLAAQDDALRLACGPLIADPACRDAIWGHDVDPAAQAGHALEVCAVAYCPELAPPAPAACVQPAPMTAAVRYEMWRELRRRILIHDDGARIAELLDQEVVVPAPPRAAPSPP